MNRLDELVRAVCPDGVNHIAIGKLIKQKRIITITPSIKIKRNDYLTEGATPIISQEAEYISGYCNLTDKNILKDSYVCFGDHSEHIKFIDFAFVQGADGLKIMRTDETVLSARYLFHAASNFYCRHNNYERHFKYFTDTIIPLPPLSVQQEIVRILDSFTELTTELNKKLTAELTARRKQYEHYRDELLSSNAPRWEKKVIQRRLSEVADISTGSSNTDDAIENGLYPFYVRSQEPLAKNEYEFDEEAIITAGDGVGVGKVFHYVKGKFALHQRAYRIHPTADTLNGRFLYHYFIAKFPAYIGKQMYQGSVPSIRRPMLNNFEVLIPPIEVQQQIVDILDRFDLICSNLTSGLPAEIAARQKQYEYYRNKLLTFKELGI